MVLVECDFDWMKIGWKLYCMNIFLVCKNNIYDNYYELI